MAAKPDILLFFSDQHHARYAGFAGDPIIRTPNMDRLAEHGTVFDAAYTSCPLCVPARSSFLTAQLPSRLGIFTNKNEIRPDQPTVMHALAAEGYETVLCGRMHFKGFDQRHGFTKRLIGDITCQSWGVEGAHFGEYSEWTRNPEQGLNREYVGGGDSITLAYDEAVMGAALDYLNEDHDKPQCIVVGLHGPHPPYVAPRQLYRDYRNRVDSPEAPPESLNYADRTIQNRITTRTEDDIQRARAAYYGMIENVDRQLGMVRSAWEDYLNRNSREGIFIYFSDHGDQAGERGLFAKQTFFEGSAAIPMIFEGAAIPAQRRIASPVSIMDIGVTLCDIVGATPPPVMDGQTLRPALMEGQENADRHVFSECVFDGFVPGRMVRRGRWKLIQYADPEEEELLFDIEADPMELRNVIDEQPQVTAELRQLIQNGWDPDAISEDVHTKWTEYELLAKWGATAQMPEPDRWSIPPYAKKRPDVTR